MGKAKRLTKVEKKFVQTLLANLPPVIARKEVTRFLGGIVAPQTLANADASGEGPEDAFRVGNSVVYRAESLVRWIVDHFGVCRRRKSGQADGSTGCGRGCPAGTGHGRELAEGGQGVDPLRRKRWKIWLKKRRRCLQ